MPTPREASDARVVGPREPLPRRRRRLTPGADTRFYFARIETDRRRTESPTTTAQVTQVKTQEKEGYTALQLGAGSKKAKRLNRRVGGHLHRGGSDRSPRELTEFRVSPDAILPVGTAIGASHFSAGQYVDIQGRTIGKGFQGPMKRWGFRCSGESSHGTTKKSIERTAANMSLVRTTPLGCGS